MGECENVQVLAFWSSKWNSKYELGEEILL